MVDRIAEQGVSNVQNLETVSHSVSPFLDLRLVWHQFRLVCWSTLGSELKLWLLFVGSAYAPFAQVPSGTLKFSREKGESSWNKVPSAHEENSLSAQSPQLPSTSILLLELLASVNHFRKGKQVDRTILICPVAKKNI